MSVRQKCSHESLILNCLKCHRIIHCGFRRPSAKKEVRLCASEHNVAAPLIRNPYANLYKMKNLKCLWNIAIVSDLHET